MVVMFADLLPVTPNPCDAGLESGEMRWNV